MLQTQEAMTVVWKLGLEGGVTWESLNKEIYKSWCSWGGGRWSGQGLGAPG